MLTRTIFRSAARPRKLSVREVKACMSSSLDMEERLEFLNSPPYVLPGHKKITCPPMVYISGTIIMEVRMEVECSTVGDDLMILNDVEDTFRFRYAP